MNPVILSPLLQCQRTHGPLISTNGSSRRRRSMASDNLLDRIFRIWSLEVLPQRIHNLRVLRVTQSQLAYCDHLKIFKMLTYPESQRRSQLGINPDPHAATIG
jgi:hypothetical protein